jgi:metallo-beta-lactamase family protein
MKIKFMGGTGRVTGSCFLFEAEGKKILIDCGLFQGESASRGKNHDPFAFDAKTIDAMVATHSHIDHIGRIPKLYKHGFIGKIYSTKPTHDLAEIFLEDTLKLMKGEVRRKPEHDLIWDQGDLDQAMRNWEGLDYHQSFNIGNIKIEFLDAGHILGSAIVKIYAEGKVVIFSGDLGNPPAPIIEDTEAIEKADYVIMESTYGDRFHEPAEEREGKLQKALDDIYDRNGVMLIPAFAMERTQELLYEIDELVDNHRIENTSVFLDSPLAIKATAIYYKYESYFDQEARDALKSRGDIFDFHGLTITKTGEESRKILGAKKPKVIIAGSGMSTGGRILGHEINYLEDPNNMILFIGFQVKGTLGRKIRDGEKLVRIMGQEVQVNAEIREISGYSAHADQTKLINWLREMCDIESEKPKNVFLIHGEAEVCDALSNKIKSDLKLGVIEPKENEEITL